MRTRDERHPTAEPLENRDRPGGRKRAGPSREEARGNGPAPDRGEDERQDPREDANADETQQDSKNENGDGGKKPDQGSLPEWIVAGVSALLIAAVIGVLVRDALVGPEGPPIVRLETLSVRPYGEELYLVEFAARNLGGTTAAGANVEGTLRDGSRVVETSSVTLDYVPTQAVRRGGLYFTHDPARYRLELRVTGYDVP